MRAASRPPVQLSAVASVSLLVENCRLSCSSNADMSLKKVIAFHSGCVDVHRLDHHTIPHRLTIHHHREALAAPPIIQPDIQKVETGRRAGIQSEKVKLDKEIALTPHRRGDGQKVALCCHLTILSDQMIED